MSPYLNVTLIYPISALLSLLLCVSLRARMSGTVKSGTIRETVRVDGEPVDVRWRVLTYADSEKPVGFVFSSVVSEVTTTS
jgi:hypothetical protein